MHVATPVCQCSAPQSYPFRCDCLELDILSEQMHAIARAEPLIVSGQPRDYDREVMVAAWKRSQGQNTGATAGLSGSAESGCCAAPKRSLRQVARGAIGLAKATAGVDAADRQTIETRHETCQSCPHNDCGQCSKCGCWIAPKIRIHSEQCPLGNW